MASTIPLFRLNQWQLTLAQLLLQREVVLLSDYSTDNVAALALLTGKDTAADGKLAFSRGRKTKYP